MLEVSVTEPPVQNVVAPLAVIVGADGAADVVTVTGDELEEVHEPLSKCT